MNYQHIVVLFNDRLDGYVLLQDAAELAQKYQARLSLCHVLPDLRAEDYVSDSLMDDKESQQIIATKALLSELVKTVSWPVSGTLIISLDETTPLEDYARNGAVDLLVCGHKNRVFGRMTSHAMQFINRTELDVLIKHIK